MEEGGNQDQDHYKTLGLNRSATMHDIKAAFRKSALDFHPEKHAQSSEAHYAAAEHFKKVSEAYETLIDETKRSGSETCPSSGSSYYWNWSTNSRSAGGGGGNTGDGAYFWRYRSSSGTGGISGGGGTAEGFYEAAAGTNRRFLMGVGCVSVVVGSAYLIDNAKRRARRWINSRKSVEEGMEALENARQDGDC